MKKYIAFIATVLMVLAANAFADPIAVGDTVRITQGPGGANNARGCSA